MAAAAAECKETKCSDIMGLLNVSNRVATPMIQIALNSLDNKP